MPSRLHLLAALLAPLALAAAEGEALYARDVRPLLETYCIDCHGGDTRKGDLDLGRLKDEAEAVRELKTWRAVSIKVGGREMPPAKKKQPSDAERATILRWIVSARAQQPRDPGRVTLHRLNRAEYDNTVRDLCGIDLDPAKDFPADDVGQGFDNIAEVLSLPPLLLEKYLAAADAVLAKAIVDQRVELRLEAEKMEAVKAGQPLAAGADAHERTWDDAGEAWQVVKLPADGKHTVKIRAWAVNGGAEPAALMLKVDERPVKTFKVTSTEKTAGTFTATVDLAAGERRIAVAFINPISGDAAPAEPKPAPKPGQRQRPGQPPKPVPVPASVSAEKAEKPAVRTLSVDWVEVQGPSSASPPESHKRIMIAKPSDKLPKREAAKQIVERFASRAWRRPVEAADVERLLGLFDKADAANETFEDAIRLTLKAVLVSPRFLFRVERDKPGERGIAPLDDWELASRLSYFLWSSMPDDQLFELAKAGTLSQPEVLAKQARRMLFDPKARALVDGFASEWLPIRKIETIAPDPKLFPDFDKPLRKAMIDEATSFFTGIMREDRSVLEFVDCDYVWVNDRLARHYGIPGVVGTQMRKVPVTDRARGGVLGMAGILAATSNPNRTSPVKRGKFILDELIGDPVPPPPPGVGDLPDAGTEAVRPATLREQLDRHRGKPECAGCHQHLDPLGFGLEGFDAIGRLRPDAATVDAGGALPGGQPFNGAAELKKILLGVRKDDVVRCLAEKLMTYALGRALEDVDAAAIDAVTAAAAREDHKFSSLIVAICQSQPFLNRRNAKDHP